jgi:hypothetical protein
MLDATVTAWVAAAVGGVAIAMVAVIALALTWQWRATRRTQDAAQALMDVHRARLDQSLDAVAQQADAIGERGADLARSVEGLRGDVAHLSWLFGRIPAARDSIREALLDIVLPTPRSAARARGEARRERD